MKSVDIQVFDRQNGRVMSNLGLTLGRATMPTNGCPLTWAKVRRASEDTALPMDSWENELILALEEEIA